MIKKKKSWVWSVRVHQTSRLIFSAMIPGVHTGTGINCATGLTVFSNWLFCRFLHVLVGLYKQRAALLIRRRIKYQVCDLRPSSYCSLLLCTCTIDSGVVNRYHNRKSFFSVGFLSVKTANRPFLVGFRIRFFPSTAVTPTYRHGNPRHVRTHGHATQPAAAEQHGRRV